MLSFSSLRPLLQTGTSAVSRWLSYIGLGLGVLLLLCSIQMYVNIHQLLAGNIIHKNGFDFISITKNITNQNMGNEDLTMFNRTEIDNLEKQSFIAGAAPLVSTNFQLELSAGGVIPFKTNLFLESINTDFIDTLPPSFHWQEGDKQVPMIIASDFLEVFNAFGPGNGLPQISPETAARMPIVIICHGDNGEVENFSGSCVAFTDRINSALVPPSFITWANNKFGKKQADKFTRVYLKTKDANDPQLLDYLDKMHYRVNKDKTKFGRTKQILDGIFTGLGSFGLLVVILALMLFSFYLQLVIARSRESLQLLLTLGYSPRWLGKKVSARFVPIYILIVFIAVLATQFMQWAFHRLVMFDRPELDTIIHWSVLLTAVALVLLSILTNFSLVKKLLYKLG
jgi:hypothetical protein